MFIESLAAIAVVAAALPVQQPDWEGRTTLPATGLATWYDEGLMERVAAYRLRVSDVQPCPECTGYVAMPRKSDVGRRVWLVHGGRVSGPWLVVDCAARGDFEDVTKRGIVAEVSRRTARAWGMAGPTKVTVRDRP